MYLHLIKELKLYLQYTLLLLIPIQTVPPTPSRPRGGWDYHIPEEAVEHYMKYGNFPVIIVNGEDVTRLIHSLASNIAADMIKKGGTENDNEN